MARKSTNGGLKTTISIPSTRLEEPHLQILQAHKPIWDLFKVSQEKLFKVENGTRHSVRVRPQVRKMLKHLVEKNLANAHVPVLCTREELIGIIWGEKDFGSHEQDLDKLAMEIRKVLNQTADSKQWLETVTGSGYILRIDGEP